MPDSNDIDVFVSYAHSDRERVRPLVENLKAAGLSVWWDTEIEIGSKWRAVIQDRLTHARSVCAVWSAASIERDYVLDEAQYASDRGILIPALLDVTEPPLGFRGWQFVSLADLGTATQKIISGIRHLSEGGVGDKPQGSAPIQWWETIDSGAQASSYGVEAADRFLADVRMRSDLLKSNPGSERALRDALHGVRETYEAVLNAIDDFLAPLTANTPIDLGRYKPIASGRMVDQIERERGHCKRITQIYIETGGLRDSLPTTVSDEAKAALDDLMSEIASADGDLFQQMAAVGSSLAKEGAVITNLLLAEQPRLAEDHLKRCAATLIPLQQLLTQGMGKVDRMLVDLGI